ncbi:acyl-CoA N-acyltransferase [Macrophomina phaseolina]|uniref:N-alpha-acetyltransferase 40 n=1 Tax=Macrophomina phaseolina TaxID=35725 RepID=A0ABQ8GNS4_9PEZI|nr:acyl-CoA N-acyltransferase [Macrophomina phaseolina]
MAAGALKRPRRPKTDPETLIDRINALSPAAFAQRFFPPSSTLLRYRDYEITLKSVTTIADGDFSSCFKLVESTSAADYKSSSRGWRPKDKLREMREDHMRYLLVREKPSELDTSTVGNDIVAFCSFMFTIEDDYPVVYIYEIHLAESHRRSGLGRHLMRIVEHCATEGAVDKAMLTCFRCNTLAMAFYTKLGYEEDEFSPPAKRLRGGKIKLPSYLIMSKRVG